MVEKLTDGMVSGVAIDRKKEMILLVPNLVPEKPQFCYGLPGGRVEIGEPPIKAVEREWLEETGQKIGVKTQPIPIKRVGRDGGCYTHYFFPIRAPRLKGLKKEETPGEVGPPEWVPLQKIINRGIKVFHNHIEGIHLVLEKMAKKNINMAFIAMALTPREYEPADVLYEKE